MNRHQFNQAIWFVIKTAAFLLANFVWFAVILARLVDSHLDSMLGIGIAGSMFVLLFNLLVVGDTIYDLTMSKKI